MSILAIKLKIMPKSPETNLDELKKNIEEKAVSLGAKNLSFEEEPIAFGLKALIMTLAWPEEKSADLLEDSLKKMKEINSVQIIDYRRAIG